MEKVLGTIQVYQKELRCDNTYAGAMYSGDLIYNVEFMDEEWLSYDTLEWYGANVIDGSSQVLDYDFATKKLKVPYGLYQQDGLIYITLRGISGSTKYSADLLRLNVGLAVNIEKNNIVEDPSWIDTATEIIEELITSKYNPVSSGLIAEAKKQQEVVKELQSNVQVQQTQIDTAVSQLGIYEWNGSQIRFKQGDGTWGEWHDVAGDFLTIDDYTNGMIESGEEYSGPASDKGIELYRVEGSTKQVTTNGYQLFDSSKVETKTQGGATVKNNNDGSFTISGSGNLTETFSNLFDYSKEESLKLLKAGIYRSNVENITPQIRFGLRNASTMSFVSNKCITSSIKSITLTEEDIQSVEDGTNILSIGFYGNNNNAIVTGTVKPMIYIDGDGTWEPFTGGKPAPNPDYPMDIENVEISNITAHGRQLFDASKLPTKSQGGATVTNNGDGSFTISGSGNLSESYTVLYNCSKEESLKLLKAGIVKSNVENTIPQIRFGLRNVSDGTFVTGKCIAYNYKTITLTEEDIQSIENGTNILSFGFLGNSGNTITPATIKPMLYQDGDGTWEAFKHATIETSLTLAQDDIYQNNLITRARKQVTFDGSVDEAWGIPDATNTFYIVIYDKNKSKPNTILSNRFIRVAYNTSFKNMKNGQIKEDGKNLQLIYIKIDGINNVSELRTWLSTHNLVVEYELATPTTEEFKVPTIPSYEPYTEISTNSVVDPTITFRPLPFTTCLVGEATEEESGYMPPLSGNSNEFMAGDGNWKDIISAIDSRISAKILTFFPVGTVIQTTNSANPSTYLGGTWEAFAPGRVLIGAGQGNDGTTSMSFTAGSTGGSYQHTNKLEEMVAHSHPIKTFPDEKWLGVWSSSASNGELWEVISPTDTGTDYKYVEAFKDDKAKSKPFSILNPYTTIYRWRRVS